MIWQEVFDEIFTLELAIAGGVFVLVTGSVLAAIVLNRERRRKHLPSDREENMVLEVSYAVLLGCIAAFLVTITALANDRLFDRQAEAQAAAQASGKPPVRVSVTGFQWCWELGYLERGVTVTDSCADRENTPTRENIPTLVVPTGRPVELAVTSRDVIHAMWIPDLAVKADAWPDHVNHVTILLEEEGRWLVRCSEFCGTHHVTMDFYLRAVSPQEYQQWLQTGSTV